MAIRTTSLLLPRISDPSTHAYSSPSTQINTGDDLTFFLTSTAYRDLQTWLLQLNRSMFPIKQPDGKVEECSLEQPPTYDGTVMSLRGLVEDFRGFVKDAPPDTGPRRFGNVAFRAWMKLVEERCDDVLSERLGEILRTSVGDGTWKDAREELKTYLLGSFGSAQRLDYGTGHELSFLAFLGGLWKVGCFQQGEERAIVMGVLQPYLDLIRHLVLTYTLEPAGSHGVWGLDDHSFAPYIFGSAQLGPALSSTTHAPSTEGSLQTAPTPSTVTDKPLVASLQHSNMYFSAIQFIYDVKRGPFWEHSPVLYDISGIKDGWAKINKGMLKMYAAEVLGKFPVVQHFVFGSLYAWEADEAAAGESTNSVHLREQIGVGRSKSMDVPDGPPAGQGPGSGGNGPVGTKAPWARGGGAGMPGGMGMPSTRAPPAPGPGGRRTLPPGALGQSGTSAPWARDMKAPTPGGPGPPPSARREDTR